MNRRTRPWASLCCVSALLACGSETPPPLTTGGAGGAAAGSSSGGGPTSGTGGTPGTAGSANAGSSTGGSSGQNAGGGGAAGSSTAAGSGGTGGGGGAAGSAGGGGDPNLPMLPKRVLLYYFSTLDIASISAQITTLKTQLEAWDYEVEDSEDPADINAQNLATFGAVGMINTCFEPFGMGKSGDAEAAALKTFVESGGGLFSTHCGSVTFATANPPHAYNQLLGGRGGDGFFNGLSNCKTTSEQHPSTMMLPATFDYTGDIDNADYVAPDTKVLVTCKWTGGAQKDHAVSWYRTAGKGRVFHTTFAKEDKDLKDATIGAKHIMVGLGWVLGR